MKKIVFCLTTLSLLLVSCSIENNVTESNPEHNKIDPFVTFVIGDSTYLFSGQDVEGRYLSNVNLENSQGLNDSILIGYSTRFSGIGGYLDLFISKKFAISDLENTTENISENTHHAEQLMNWPEYQPTEAEFESMFCPGKKEILKNHYFWTREEGVAVFLNDFTWTSYDPHNDNSANTNFQIESRFEINSIDHISNEAILNLFAADDFSSAYADKTRDYILVELSFEIDLFNKDDSTKVLKLRDGQIKAVFFN